ncbi:hypothetical protein DPMN_130972 [Dreissena polymorpha]|uniref:Uncharacterized protein n=1 Tax=Dreissena polymorpha TaxID=45954 RepID=A0A9D4H3S9_DREPO|nr:hypothetical protein DPMN_130972 [Dreissena polymorpha]
MRCLFVLCVVGLAMNVSAKATGDATKSSAGDVPAVEAPAVDTGKGTAAPTDAAEAKSANGNAYACKYLLNAIYYITGVLIA